MVQIPFSPDNRNNFHLHLSDNLIFLEDYATIDEAVENAYAGFRLESEIPNLTSEALDLIKIAKIEMLQNGQTFYEYLLEKRNNINTQNQ